MKKMKLFAIVMSMLLIIGSLAGCGGGTEPNAEGEGEGQTLVAFAQGELVNAWRVTNQKDMEAQAETFGFKLVSTDANQDPAKQLADVESLLAQNPAALIVPPLESEALVPIVEMCNAAGVPLFIIDRTINATPGEGMYITEITQSHVISGEILAKKTVELLTEKYGEPKGNVVHVQGQAGASPVIDANQGWANVMKDYPNIKEIAVADAGFTKQGGMQVMEDFLQRFPAGEIDVVRTDYSDMTIGALEAIKNAGRTELLGYIMGEGGHIKCIEAVIAGDIACETQTPPYFGELAMDSVTKYLAGESIPAKQEVPIKVFESNKADEAQAYYDEISAKGLEF